jgi:hypothetical protein
MGQESWGKVEIKTTSLALQRKYGEIIDMLKLPLGNPTRTKMSKKQQYYKYSFDMNILLSIVTKIN